MNTDTMPPCANCQRLQAEVDALRHLVALQATVEQLQKQLAAALKNSSNSSKPPSSDIVKPPKPQPPPARSGASPAASRDTPHTSATVPARDARLRPHRLPPRRLPRLRRAPARDRRRTDPCRPAGRHPRRAPGDPRAPQSSGLVPPLSQDPLRPAPALDRARRPGRAAVDHRHRLPQGGLSRLVLDHPQVHPRCDRLDHLPRAIGQDHRQGQPGAERPYEELLDHLPDQDFLNVDETGHKQNGQRQWTWCFRAELYTLFKIDPTRSGDVLIEVLGTEFDGVLGCDYFSAYRRYHREFGVALQFCLAHLIRDVKFLTTLPDARDRAYGERLLGGLRSLFAVIHRREDLSERDFQGQLEAARAQCCDWGRTTCRRRGPVPTWPSGSRRMGRAIFGSSRLRVWDRRTIWRNRRSGSW